MQMPLFKSHAPARCGGKLEKLWIFAPMPTNFTLLFCRKVRWDFQIEGSRAPVAQNDWPGKRQSALIVAAEAPAAMVEPHCVHELDEATALDPTVDQSMARLGRGEARPKLSKTGGGKTDKIRGNRKRTDASHFTSLTPEKIRKRQQTASSFRGLKSRGVLARNLLDAVWSSQSRKYTLRGRKYIDFRRHFQLPGPAHLSLLRFPAGLAAPTWSARMSASGRRKIDANRSSRALRTPAHGSLLVTNWHTPLA